MEKINIVDNLIESLLANEGLGYSIDIVAKSSLLLLLMYSLLLFLHKSSSTTKHLICFFALVSTLMIPPVSYYWPNKVNIPVLPAILNPVLAETELDTAASEIDMLAYSNESRITISSSEAFTIEEVKAILIRTYFAVLLLFIVYFIVGLINISFISRRSQNLHQGQWYELLQILKHKYGIKRKVRVLISREITSPLVWGLFRPVVIIPFNAVMWNKECKEQVLLHELSHIKRFDFVTQLLAYFVCVLYWFNPLVWFIRRNTSLYAESACDDLVILHGINPIHYAKQLVVIAENVMKKNAYHLSAVSMSGSIELTDRVHAILNHRQDRAHPRRSYASFVVVLIVTLALCLASLQLSRKVGEPLLVSESFIALADSDVQGPPILSDNIDKETTLMDSPDIEQENNIREVNNHASAFILAADDTAIAEISPLINVSIIENSLSQSKITDSSMGYIRESTIIFRQTDNAILQINTEQAEVISNEKISDKLAVDDRPLPTINTNDARIDEQYNHQESLAETVKFPEGKKSEPESTVASNEPSETSVLKITSSIENTEKTFNTGENGDNNRIVDDYVELSENSITAKEKPEMVPYIHEIIEQEVKKEEPIALFQVRPSYPKRALLRNIEGWSVVEFTVTDNGYVKDIKLLESSNDVFVRPSLKIVKKWKYKPATYNGEAVEAKNIKTKITYMLSNT